MRPWVYALLAFLGGVSFGIPSTFVKIAYQNGFNTAEVVGAQYLFGALLFWVTILFIKKVKTPFSMVIKLAVSGVPMAITGVFYYNSLNYLDASIAIIMLFQFTWMGLIGEWIIDRVQPTREKIISVTVLFIGSLFAVNLFGSSVDSLPIQGILLGLLGALFFTVFIFVSGRVGVSTHPIRKSMFMTTGALIVIFIIYPPVTLFTEAIGDGLWIWGSILGIFGVVLPPILFSISMPQVGSGLGTILSASELPTAVCMSIIVLNEHVSWIQWIGVVLVLLGVILPTATTLYKQRRHRYGT